MRSVALLSDPRSAAAEAALVAIDDEDRLYVPGEHDTDVVVEVDPEAYELVAEYANVETSTSSNRGTIRVTIKVGHLPNLGHLISKYGGAARVIEPAAARDIVRNYALASLGESIPVEAPGDEE
jgi:proteasome accessory factor C